MTRTRAILAVLLVLTGIALAGCQTSPPSLPTPAATATLPPSPTVTATALPIAPAETPTSTLAPTIGAATPTTAATPTPTASRPAISDVPVTNNAVQVPEMPSRNHFPESVRIRDVDPNGYNSVPPTSGQHWPRWSVCGFFNHPLPDELLVHNLEHGNIIVSYNLPDEADVSALRAAVSAIPSSDEIAIVRRYPDIPVGMVAITTWGVLDRMMGVDPERIADFFRRFPGNTGPEFANGLPCTTGADLMQSSGG
jgi:hypothetical protein